MARFPRPLVLLFVFGLTACGGKSGDSPKTSTAPAQQTTKPAEDPSTPVPQPPSPAPRPNVQFAVRITSINEIVRVTK